MKNLKRKIIILVGVLLVVVTSGAIFLYNKTKDKPLKSNGQFITVEVKEGEGFYSVLDQLKSKGELKNEFMVKAYLKLNDKKPKAVVGTHTFSSNITLDQLIKELESQNNIKVVIPEGKNIKEIAQILQKAGLFSKNEFLEAVRNYKLPNFIKNNDKRRYALEGFLFPDTYVFRAGITPNEVIKTMLDNFKNVFNEAEKETGVKVKDDEIDNIVTKASIIEKESRTDKDRPLISSVIDNRLKINMPLQIDATVIYALGKHVDVVSYNHLKIDSPYNTYKFKGLPIGPISNPGKESIIAALKPAKTNYLYYILIPKTNNHKFTSSGEEFNKLRKEYGYDK